MKSKLTICITYIDSKIKQKYLMNPFVAFSLCQDINNWNKEYHLIYFCVFCFIIILWSLFTKYNITFSKVFIIHNYVCLKIYEMIKYNEKWRSKCYVLVCEFELGFYWHDISLMANGVAFFMSYIVLIVYFYTQLATL